MPVNVGLPDSSATFRKVEPWNNRSVVTRDHDLVRHALVDFDELAVFSNGSRDHRQRSQILFALLAASVNSGN